MGRTLMRDGLAGHVALVTGTASGIGEAVAVSLAKRNVIAFTGLFAATTSKFSAARNLKIYFATAQRG
jgi:NAD(P)-dependent dehydrogenase (short-subunit alcohol dehydrogenase family)